MKYAQRDKMSYLWTFLRDPTDRAMSVVGATLSQQLLQSSNRDSFDPTMSTNLTGQTDNILVYRTLHMLQNATNDGILGQGFGGYQLEVCMQDYTKINEVIYPSNPTEVADVSQLIDSVSRVSSFGMKGFSIGVLFAFFDAKGNFHFNNRAIASIHNALGMFGFTF